MKQYMLSSQPDATTYNKAAKKRLNPLRVSLPMVYRLTGVNIPCIRKWLKLTEVCFVLRDLLIFYSGGKTPRLPINNLAFHVIEIIDYPERERKCTSYIFPMSRAGVCCWKNTFCARVLFFMWFTTTWYKHHQMPSSFYFYKTVLKAQPKNRYVVRFTAHCRWVVLTKYCFVGHSNYNTPIYFDINQPVLRNNASN